MHSHDCMLSFRFWPHVQYDDLYSTSTRSMANTGDVQTRKKCTQSTTPKQPFAYCIPADYDSGIAITGIVDKQGANAIGTAIHYAVVVIGRLSPILRRGVPNSNRRGPMGRA